MRRGGPPARRLPVSTRPLVIVDNRFSTGINRQVPPSPPLSVNDHALFLVACICDQRPDRGCAAAKQTVILAPAFDDETAVRC